MGLLCQSKQRAFSTVNNCYYLPVVISINIYEGSGSIEGFHKRLESMMPRTPLPLDKMVDFLAAEDEYWNRMVHDERLWQEKKMSHSAAQERHVRKRRMLKHYVQRENNPVHDSIPLSFSSDLLSSSDGDSSSRGSAPSTVNVENEILPSSPLMETDKPKKIRKPRRPNSSIPMGERCIKCMQYKFNEACSLVMCKTCCVQSSSKCKETSHNRAKFAARQPLSLSSSIQQQVISESTVTSTVDAIRIKELVQTAIETKSDIYISYSKGSNGTKPRKIKPTGLSTEPF